jgi:DNA-binding phage protein
MRAIRAIGTVVCLAAFVVVLFGHRPTNIVALLGLLAMASGMSAVAANTVIRRRRLRSFKKDLDEISRLIQ